MHQSLSCINSEAVACLKASKHIEAIVTFDKLFKRLAAKHLTHADLHTCYNNRAAAFLCLHLYDEALQDAEQARKLAKAALKRFCTVTLLLHLALCTQHKYHWQEACSVNEFLGCRTPKAFGPYVKSLSRKTSALVGMNRLECLCKPRSTPCCSTLPSALPTPAIALQPSELQH